MADYQQAIRTATQAVRVHAQRLLDDPNVHGIGVGHKMITGNDTGEPVVAVFVSHKLPIDHLSQQSIIPKQLAVGGDSIETDVIESPPPYQQENTARIRPARPGTSIGEISITAGTFGAVVIDEQTDEPLILSNNHVLADNNQAQIGSPIVQPGPFDGGRTRDDIIATLLRFVPLSPAHDNLVDAAVARPGSPTLIANNPLNGVPAPSQANPAYGLLWGGATGSHTLACPIASVLALLDVRLPNADAVGTAAIGDQVQKTGRTTERTTGSVTHVNVTARVNASPLGTITLVNQIRMTDMSRGGDSGSLIVAA